MKNLTREEILERGWSQDAFEQFARKSYKVNKNKEPVWELSFLEKVETSLNFINFTNKEEFQERRIKVDALSEENTKQGISHVKALEIAFHNHDCLLRHTKDYDSFKPIFHLVKKDFAPDPNGSYSLFTDGAFKTIGKAAFACCAGWIMDNNSKEIIIEFTKPLELKTGLDDQSGRGMPDFELMGIFEGVKIIDQLGLKNVQCYTDSNGETKTILYAINKMGDKRIQTHIELYQPIIEILTRTKSSIGWVPRDYNIHADELTKYPLNMWANKYQAAHGAVDYVKDNGYVVDRDKEIYYHQDKVRYGDIKKSSAKSVLIVFDNNFEASRKHEKTIVTMLLDKETSEITLLDSEKKDYSYIDSSLGEDIKKVKMNKTDGINLMMLSKAIKKLSHLKKLDVCTPPGAIAVLQKYVPIPGALQEEYFEFHDTCEKFKGKLNLVSLDPKLINVLNKYLKDVFTPQNQLAKRENIEDSEAKRIKP